MQIPVADAIAGLDFQYSIDQDDMIQDALVILRMVDKRTGRVYPAMTFTSHTDRMVLDGMSRVYEDKRALQNMVQLEDADAEDDD